jgi:hypothetical protein
MEALSDLQSFWKGAGKAIAQIQDLAQPWRVVGILPMRFSMPVVRKTRVQLSNAKSAQIPQQSEVIDRPVDPPSTEYFLQQPRSDLLNSEEGHDTSLFNYDLESMIQDYTGMPNPANMGAFPSDATATQTEYNIDHPASFDFDLFALQDLNSFESFTAFQDIDFLFREGT